MNLGTSSDRIGTGKGPHAYYLTFAKNFSDLRLGPYVSINYSEADKQINFPFGLSYGLALQLTTMFMNDGRKSHLLLTYAKETWSVSAMWIWFRYPGISVSFGF